MPPASITKHPQLFLVLDDLALELHDHPIHVPIPATLPRTDAAMKRFTLQVYRDFMRLKHFSWTHGIADVIVDSL